MSLSACPLALISEMFGMFVSIVTIISVIFIIAADISIVVPVVVVDDDQWEIVSQRHQVSVQQHLLQTT